MIQLDELWRKAKADLTIRSERDRSDSFLWEHAERVAQSAEAILELIGQAGTGVDREVLAAAALFHCAGWVVVYEEGTILRAEILAKPPSDILRELSSDRAEQSLRSILSDRKMKAVCNTIREAGWRDTTNLAAQVIAEACNLDQIGPMALWQIVRRQFEEGGSVSAALKIWNRQKEYNFWHARIKDTFRFEPVKRIAYRRLEAMDHFMAAVEDHVGIIDLKQAVVSAHAPTTEIQQDSSTMPKA